MKARKGVSVKGHKIGNLAGSSINQRSFKKVGRFTVEPSTQKDYNISLMTGKNNNKGSDSK